MVLASFSFDIENPGAGDGCGLSGEGRGMSSRAGPARCREIPAAFLDLPRLWRVNFSGGYPNDPLPDKKARRGIA
jgi:hypothetical protein